MDVLFGGNLYFYAAIMVCAVCAKFLVEDLFLVDKHKSPPQYKYTAAFVFRLSLSRKMMIVMVILDKP